MDQSSELEGGQMRGGSGSDGTWQLTRLIKNLCGLCGSASIQQTQISQKQSVWLWKGGLGAPFVSVITTRISREKTKAEAKDRKVLEILQVKDARIKELQKRESGLQQEINTLVEKKIAVDEENVFLKKELSDLQKKFKDQSQELKNTKERVQKKEEKNILIIKELEEENKELSIRCAELLNDLENLRKQETQWKKEKHDIDCKMKISAADLTEAKRKIEESWLKCKELTLQLNQKQAEIKQKDVDITLVKQVSSVTNKDGYFKRYINTHIFIIFSLNSFVLKKQVELYFEE